MTRFEDVKFPGKYNYRKSVLRDVTDILDHTLDMKRLSPTKVRRYLEILIDYQDFNPKAKCFYDRATNRKLSYQFLAQIAHEYIIEHIDEFEFAEVKK